VTGPRTLGARDTMPPAARMRPPLVDPAGGPPSFAEVYRTHAATVGRWAERLGGPRADHDAIVQDVFLTVSRRLSEFRGEAKLTTWLFRITARVAANHRRTIRRRHIWARLSRRIEAVSAAPAASPADAIESRQAMERFHRVLDSLAERYRQVLILFELESMTVDEIAGFMNRPAATIRVWLHRARAQFGTRWQDEQRKEEGL
jgi:RNA polymerase sigma-70 factor (ECF subfamily)